MADRYWVGGTATWDGTAGTKWAATSGGAGGVAIPTTNDDVYFDANSGAVTVTTSTSATCKSVNCVDGTGGAFTGTLTISNSATGLTIAGSATGAGNVALKLSAGMTLSIGGANSAIVFSNTSGTQQTITSAGKTMPSMTFSGAGGSYIFSDAITTSNARTVTLSNGTLDLNGLSHSIGLCTISGSSTRTLTFNGATLSLSGTSGNVWNAGTTTNLTFTPDTGTIAMTATGSTLGVPVFNGGSLTYNIVSFSGTFGVHQISGANTFGTLTIAGGASTTCEVRFNSNQTITGTLTVTGNSVTNRLLIRSATIGTSRTLTVGTLSSNSFVDFINITAGGASSPWSDSGWGVQSVTNITGATPVTTYWVGGSGNSNDTNEYASSSGGVAGTQRAPLIQDTAIFDANSGTGTLTINSPRLGSMDFTNTALTAVSWSGGFVFQMIAGSWIGVASCPITTGGFANTVTFIGTGSHTLSMPNTSWDTHPVSFAGNGTYTLGSDITLTNVGITNTSVTFSSAGYTMSGTTFTWTSGNVSLGSSTIYVTGTGAGTLWTGGTNVNGGTSNIWWTDNGTANQTFAGGGGTYYMLHINGGGSGLRTISGSNTFQGILMYGSGTKTVRFTAGTTQTLNSNNFLQGKSGAIITITSTTGGSAYTISATGFKITSDYISLQDCTGAGSTPHYAGGNSTNVSGNTNWTFTNAPGASQLTSIGVG